jgi:Fe-S-cluster containining protein
MINERKPLRFICTRCGNCCTDKNTLVNVTYSDILNIKNGLKLTYKELLEIIGFYIFEKEPDQEILKKMIVPPIETERGLAFVGLIKKSDGSCFFFDRENNNCKIYKIRPNFCRTFPFSFKILFDKFDKTKAKIKMYYTEKGKKYCPGIGEDAPLINDDEWIQLGKKTIEDINHNNVLITKWNEAVKKNKIKPSVKNFLLTIINLDEDSKSK